MTEPGDQRPSGTGGAPAASGRGWSRGRMTARPSGPTRSVASALVLATLIALLAAVAWAVLRGLLELGASALAVAALGGWGIGAVLRQAWAPITVAACVGFAAWLLGLLLSWLLAMALLPGSTRTFPERLANAPFIDWLSPQFGLLEIAGLVVMVGVAAYTARPAARPRA